MRAGMSGCCNGVDVYCMAAAVLYLHPSRNNITLYLTMRLQVLGWGGAALATPLVMLVSGAIFFAGTCFPPGTALPGTALAMMLALGPAAGIVAQVRGLRVAVCDGSTPGTQLAGCLVDLSRLWRSSCLPVPCCAVLCYDATCMYLTSYDVPRSTTHTC